MPKRHRQQNQCLDEGSHVSHLQVVLLEDALDRKLKVSAGETEEGRPVVPH